MRTPGAGGPRFARTSSVAKLRIVTLLFLGLRASAPVSAQISNSHPDAQLDADRLAGDVFQNEINAQINDHSLWCYRELKEERGEKRLFEACQTKDGEINRLLEVNGEPLNRKQCQAEDQRIQKLLNYPDKMRKEQEKQQEDARQAQNLMKMVANAFRFQYEGTQGSLIKLKFSPNPSFHPSGRMAQVFHHMEGSLLIDGQQERLAEINGQLTSEVKFAGGLLGHLDQGGTFFVKQQDLGSGHWELTTMDVQMNGRALLFKTIAVRERETYTDFRQAPGGVTPQQGFELLRQDPAFRGCH